MNDIFENQPAIEIKEIDSVISRFNSDLAQQLKNVLESNVDQQENTDLNQKELETWATMKSLPKDPLERMLLLDEFKKHPDARFSDSALTALEALGAHGKEVRIKIKKDWRDCLTYPQHVARWAIDKLDEIATLVEMPEFQDRYSRMSEFLEIAKKSGLLNEADHRRIKDVIAKEL